MNEEQIRAIVEQVSSKGDKYDQEELIAALKNVDIPVEGGGKIGTTEEDLRAQLTVETDWRKKASIAAKIISLGLDT